MKKWCVCLGCLSLLGCNEGYRVKLKCDPAVDLPRCAEDENALMICKDGVWIRNSCEQACVYTENGAACDKQVGTCFVGEQTCTSGGFLAVCDANARWTYRVCPGGCKDKVCDETIPEPEPEEPQPERVTNRRCSTDKLSIEYLNAENNVIETRSCIEVTGFESTCRAYANGHVGCAMPDSCIGAFENGECKDNKYFGCDRRYFYPRPYVVSCDVTGTTCVSDAGVSGCYEMCSNPNAAMVCSNDGTAVERCVTVGQKNVVVRDVAVCKDDSTSVVCTDGRIEEKICDSGYKCLKSKGICAELCDAEHVGQLKCSPSGELLNCEATDDGYAYVSVGRRHCLGDELNLCVSDNFGGYALKKTDCATNYVDPDSGEPLPYRCVTDYQYYLDWDLCMPVNDQGVECGNVTESGVCIGSKLRYCHAEDHILMEGDCAKSQDGYTNCSVVSGYADCRKPCRDSGKGTCTLEADGITYALSLCTPADGGGNLTLVDGEAICSGNKLHTCNSSGEMVVENCEAFGGICDLNGCSYPACRADLGSVCLMDDMMVSCRIGSDGLLEGEAVQTMFCDADGKCRHCEQGKVVVQ